jgi:hypothetical protein
VLQHRRGTADMPHTAVYSTALHGRPDARECTPWPRCLARSRALCGTRILEKCEEYLRRHPGRQRQGIVPDLQIGTSLYELKGMRSDRSHSNCNGAQVTGVEKRGVKIPMEIQKQAVDLDEKMFGVGAPAVGPWQRQLNELAGRGSSTTSTGNSGPDLSSSWTSWRRRVRTKRPSGTSSPTA